jgi:hypothetical protein
VRFLIILRQLVVDAERRALDRHQDSTEPVCH